MKAKVDKSTYAKKFLLEQVYGVNVWNGLAYTKPKHVINSNGLDFAIWLPRYDEDVLDKAIDRAKGYNSKLTTPEIVSLLQLIHSSKDISLQAFFEKPNSKRVQDHLGVDFGSYKSRFGEMQGLVMETYVLELFLGVMLPSTRDYRLRTAFHIDEDGERFESDIDIFLACRKEDFSGALRTLEERLGDAFNYQLFCP